MSLCSTAKWKGIIQGFKKRKKKKKACALSIEINKNKIPIEAQVVNQQTAQKASTVFCLLDKHARQKAKQ